MEPKQIIDKLIRLREKQTALFSKEELEALDQAIEMIGRPPVDWIKILALVLKLLGIASQISNHHEHW